MDLCCQDWMSALPEELWDTPLTQLAIPGTHDPFSLVVLVRFTHRDIWIYQGRIQIWWTLHVLVFCLVQLGLNVHLVYLFSWLSVTCKIDLRKCYIQVHNNSSAVSAHRHTIYSSCSVEVGLSWYSYYFILLIYYYFEYVSTHLFVQVAMMQWVTVWT